MNDTVTKPDLPISDLPRDEGDLVSEAMERWSRAYEFERENQAQANEDLRFRAGDQWPDKIKQDREAQGRPCLTINKIPQFIRQITGDIRQMKPAIKCVPVDERGDPKTAEVMGGLIRYIENRSDAPGAYFTSADSQVTAGIGHWRVVTEYADETTFDQELRIVAIEDGVSVLWDPDAVLPTREDATHCFVPVDMSLEAFKKKYPNKDASGVSDNQTEIPEGWFSSDTVRVAEYWVKKPATKLLALLPDGTIDDVTDAEPEIIEFLKAQQARIEARKTFKVCRYIVSATQVLEGPLEWPGRYIPVVPVLGEEVRIGGKVIRHGAVRYARDPQRTYNYFVSAETEIVALQPKAPFLGTEKNFETYEDDWSRANTDNLPFLVYTPDESNGGIQPSRVTPPVSSQGIMDGLRLASEDMKAVIGIYDASLGARSNETSGKAIMARQREGDVGAYVYIDNFTRAIRYTGKLLIDLIPHIYDTERTIRVVGEDGAVDTARINQPVVVDGEDHIVHDVTTGAYDVVLDTGPSYSTKREEAKEGMTAFIQASPDAGAVIMDLYAKSQDWPMADRIAKRLRALLPPQIQALEAQEGGEEEPLPPPQPNPAEQAEMAQANIDLQIKQIDLKMKEIDLLERELEARLALQSLEAGGSTPQFSQPVAAE